MVLSDVGDSAQSCTVFLVCSILVKTVFQEQRSTQINKAIQFPLEYEA